MTDPQHEETFADTERKLREIITTLRAQLAEAHTRIEAMESGDWSELKLVRFENGQMDITAGPIPAIAEYLAQMMQDGEGKYFNFMEVSINHKTAGPMTLSLQRKNGKTPNQLRKEAEARAERAEAALAAQIERDAGIALKHRNNLNALTSLPPQSAAAWNIYNEIRAQAHDRSALDAMIAEARAQALREAVNEINCGCRIEEGGCVFPHACPQEDVSAILALIEKPDAT